LETIAIIYFSHLRCSLYDQAADEGDEEYESVLVHTAAALRNPSITSDPTREFGLHDKLYAIYRQDCTIRVPWLNLNYISPLSLLSHNDDNLVRSTVAELSSNQLVCYENRA